MTVVCHVEFLGNGRRPGAAMVELSGDVNVKPATIK